jgi:hypothetical protein
MFVEGIQKMHMTFFLLLMNLYLVLVVVATLAAGALFDFDSTKPRQVFDENVDGQVDSSSTLNMWLPRPPQSNATPGAFRVGDSNSNAGTVIVGTPHQDVQNVQTGSIAPVEAEIAQDDLQERRELEAQLQRVLEERENAPIAQVVDTSIGCQSAEIDCFVLPLYSCLLGS